MKIGSNTDVPQNLQKKSRFPSPCVFPPIKELCKSFAQIMIDVELNIYSLLMCTVPSARQITLLHCLCIKSAKCLHQHTQEHEEETYLMGRAKEMIKTSLLYKVPCPQSGKGSSGSSMIACESCAGTSPELDTACKFCVLGN